MNVQIETVATSVTLSALRNWYNNPEVKAKEFCANYTLGDGTPMKPSDLKKLCEQAGLDYDARPKRVQIVHVFQLVDDTTLLEADNDTVEPVVAFDNEIEPVEVD